MRKLPKVLLLALGALAVLSVVITVIAALLLRADAKPRVEAIASDALQMEVSVAPRPTIGFLPGLHVALEDVHVRNRGAEVAAAGEVDLRIELMPLLHHQIRIDKIGLRRLTIAIERNRDGKLNVDRLTTTTTPIPALAVTSVTLSDASLSVTDRQSGHRLELAGCTMNMGHVQLSSGRGSDFLRNLSVAGQGTCRQIRTADVTASELSFSVTGTNGVFDFDPVTTRLFGGQGSGAVRADLSGSVPLYHVHYRLAQFRIDQFFQTVASSKIAEGSMDFAADMSMRGTTVDGLTRTCAGEASLHGADLILHIGDIDKSSSRYESSQRFNLVDVAAVFFAGPLGLGVTKGYDYARIFQDTGGDTTVRTLVSEWHVENGIAAAKDVAMDTPKNRVALKGTLDFVTGRFEDVTVALVNAKGCPQIQQKVHGPFLQPVIEKPSVLASLTGPTRRLIGQAANLLGRKCEVFYSGSVAPPQ